MGTNKFSQSLGLRIQQHILIYPKSMSRLIVIQFVTQISSVFKTILQIQFAPFLTHANVHHVLIILNVLQHILELHIVGWMGVVCFVFLIKIAHRQFLAA